MDEPKDLGRAKGGKGCGCLAALAVLVVIGLPVLFMFSFGLSPCKDGPCNPNGMRNLQGAAAVVTALAALVGVSVWRLVRSCSVRAAAGAGPAAGARAGRPPAAHRLRDVQARLRLGSVLNCLADYLEC